MKYFFGIFRIDFRNLKISLHRKLKKKNNEIRLNTIYDINFLNNRLKLAWFIRADSYSKRIGGHFRLKLKFLNSHEFYRRQLRTAPRYFRSGSPVIFAIRRVYGRGITRIWTDRDSIKRLQSEFHHVKVNKNLPPPTRFLTMLNVKYVNVFNNTSVCACVYV